MTRQAVIDLLSEHLLECRHGLQIVGARVVDVQYAPASSAHVLWKVKTRDHETQRTGRQLIVVKALGRDDAAPSEPSALVRRYAALRGRRGADREMPLRTPWLLVRPAGVLMYAFPLDPRMPTLLDVVDAEAMKEALHRAWRPRGPRVRRVRIRLLSYTPEARAALRYEVLAEDRETGVPQLRRLVGKLDARRSTPRLFAGHWAVWRRTMGRVSIAPPVGYLAVPRLSLQEFLTGTRLSDLAGRGVFIGLVRETARAIANVHALTLPLLTTRGVEKEMRSVNRWIRVLAHLRPSQAQRVESIGQRLARELSNRLHISGTVHGDFHLANVLADEHGVTLVDWDQVAHGDPMVDVGRVLASLRVASLRVHGTLAGFADVQEDFLRTYLDITRDDERRARLFEAVALLVAAATPFRLQRDGWEEGAELMLDEVERILQLSRAKSPLATGGPPEMRTEVPFDERSQWALDRPYAQALLVPVVHEAQGSDIEVTGCAGKLIDERRNRVHMRWSMHGYRGTAPWRGSFDGVSFRNDSGRGRLRRLEIANDAVTRHPGALRLLRPIGHLGPISMIVFVPPSGDLLAELLDTPREHDAIQRTAAALAAFHTLSIDLGKMRETSRYADSVRRRVRRLDQAGSVDALYARLLLERLEPKLDSTSGRLAATVLGLHPAHLRIDGTSVGVSLFYDVLLADPLVAVGDLLAELAAGALEHSLMPSTAERLRRAYSDAAGCSEETLAVFEAIGLLSRACRRGAREPTDRAVALMIEHAASLVQAGGLADMK